MTLCMGCGRPLVIERSTTSEHRRIAREIVAAIDYLLEDYPQARRDLIINISAALDQASERRGGHE